VTHATAAYTKAFAKNAIETESTVRTWEEASSKKSK